ncbi:acid phosphatase [Novosphingobium sp. JCM 18896]|uniref:acid phosphatase n=1 Tax=Novosphingobium sp. JCM 18896 TaxID=2989731 RepID=UPI002222425F|nr:phosphatase PAP2 family protein [Novosphingobium sp. JCM 18896]MCW1430766.1 phosphatase PAP2 family protein [Novosphingobium sp. JCM 18896]
MIQPRAYRLALPIVLLAAGCVASSRAEEPRAPAAAPAAPIAGIPAPGDRPASYLAAGELPDGMLLVPPPPKAGSAALARDLEGAQRAVAQRGSARWNLATSDAELFSPTSTAALSCAAGRQIDAEATPVTLKLLRRAAVDFSNSTASAKDHYKRPRPFMENGQPSCTPDAERYLRLNGSYPSGHSAIGYGWGLVLAELIPARTAALVARGRAFGDSRRVCNVHWLSDIEEGRVTATATFVRLQSNPAFAADLAAARQELATLPAIAAKRDCAAEASALAAE